MAENIIPAVEKAVAILNRLGELPKGATQSELATSLNIAPSTCYRILQTLLAADYIRKNSPTRYDLSGGIERAVRKLTNLALRFEAAQPCLETLAENTGLCAKLSIRQGFDQIPILRAESPRIMSVSGKIGVRFPIIEGSVGAALLSGALETEIRQLAAQCQIDVRERNHPELILEGIAAIRRRGYCLNAGRNRWKIDAMSVPVRDRDGDVAAAITLLGYDDDFAGERAKKMAAALLSAARRCAALLK